jgi:hypothetical protein
MDLWWIKLRWGRFYCEYFRFPRQFLFYRLLHTHHPSSRAGAVDQTVSEVPSTRLTPPQETKGTSSGGSHFQPRWPGFIPGSDHVGFVVNKMALVKCLVLRPFTFPILIPPTSPHFNRLLSWAGKIGRMMSSVSRGLSLTPCSKINFPLPEECHSWYYSKASSQNPAYRSAVQSAARMKQYLSYLAGI